MKKFQKRSLTMAIVAIFVVANITIPIVAQSNSGPLITLSVDAYDLSPLLNDEMIGGFLAQHPNVRVKFLHDQTLSNTSIISTGGDLGEFKKGANNQFSKADVFLLGTNSSPSLSLLSPTLTRLGYILNLKPYIDSDANFNPSKIDIIRNRKLRG